jgi:phosphatidylserine/phosphatidylglycerophosphate/cardiolipin synthase-like enzyme
MRRALRVGLILAALAFGTPGEGAVADPQLVSLNAVIARIGQAHAVVASAYTLSPRSRMGAALMSAARNRAPVTLILDGEGLVQANNANREAARTFMTAGVQLRLTGYRLHMKAIIIDESRVFVSDRNWTTTGANSLILALPSAATTQVLQAIYGVPTSNGQFATRKSDAIALEANMLSQRRSHTVLVETESFSPSRVSAILAQRARLGDDVTLVVGLKEYRSSGQERAELAELGRLGVHVFAASSNQKIATDGSASFCGSSNLTEGWGDQVDWGIVITTKALAATLSQQVRRDATIGIAIGQR